MAKKELKEQLKSYEGYINDIPLVIDPCKMCKNEINLPLTVKLKKHFMGRNYYGNYEPVYYEICGYEMCENCFRKTYRFIQDLKKE